MHPGASRDHQHRSSAADLKIQPGNAILMLLSSSHRSESDVDDLSSGSEKIVAMRLTTDCDIEGEEIGRKEGT